MWIVLIWKLVSVLSQLWKKDTGFQQENVYYCKDKSQILRKQH